VVVRIPEAPLVLEADPDLLERALDNLVGDALEHGPTQRPVTVEARRLDGGGVRLEVRDEGAPVPPESRSAIFHPFESRSAASGPGLHRHHGLGLAFCGLAAQAHGGTIGLEAGAESGNCFFLELPESGRAPGTTTP
jgi:signal transduction histidine kinase